MEATIKFPNIKGNLHLIWNTTPVEISNVNNRSARIEPPSEELIERLNWLASKPPFCYRFKGSDLGVR
jgi:hypothetical protein